MIRSTDGKKKKKIKLHEIVQLVHWETMPICFETNEYYSETRSVNVKISCSRKEIPNLKNIVSWNYTVNKHDGKDIRAPNEITVIVTITKATN